MLLQLTMKSTAAASMLAAVGAMAAEAYPTRPIRIVDAFAPGGSIEGHCRHADSERAGLD